MDKIKAVTWVAKEIVLKSDKKYNDPFNDVDVDLILTKGSIAYTIPAFWDGGDIWRARFTCTEEGTWTYKTVCSDEENSGLHNKENTVDCVKYTGDLDIYKHGFLKTEKDTKYFMYDDGTPFFYLGDTHWGLGLETIAMIKEIAKTRKEQGYTVFQSEPLDAKFKFQDGITEEDMEGLWEHDEKFKEIAENGLVHTNAAHFFPAFMQEFIDNHGGYSQRLMGVGVKNGEEINLYDLSDAAKTALEKICRYWVARYSAYPVMWTLAQEVDKDFFWTITPDFHNHKQWGLLNNPYKYVAEFFCKYDPYNHPLTAHQEGSSFTKASNSAFRNMKEHTWYASQWNPKVTGESIIESPADYWAHGQGKPVIRYESYYYMVQTKDFGARARSWMGLLSGMCGLGYGAQGAWYYQHSYRSKVDSDDGVDVVTVDEKAEYKSKWKEALSIPSSIQVTYIRDFFENYVGDWYTLIPRFEDTAYLKRDQGAYGVIASNSDNSKVVVYFYNFSEPTLAARPNAVETGTKTGKLNCLEANGDYKYIWYNPITGKVYSEGSFTATNEGTWIIPEKTTSDMVLYVYK